MASIVASVPELQKRTCSIGANRRTISSAKYTVSGQGKE
jgi:hypothetical protein